MSQRGQVVDDARGAPRRRRSTAPRPGRAGRRCAGRRRGEHVVARGRAGGRQWRPAKPDGAGDQDPRQFEDDRDQVLERAVAVGGGGGGVDGARLGLGRVQPPLELAEHEAEQQVAPGRLGERAAVAAERRQISGVEARSSSGVERPQREVLGQRGERAAQRRRDRQRRARRWRRRRRTRRRCACAARARRGTSRAARDRPAEQLDVVVVDAEDALVERLLRRPDARRRRRPPGAPRSVRVGRRPCPRTVTPGAGRCTNSRGVTLRMDHSAAARARARARGVNPIVYWLVRAILQPFFHIYFRLVADRPRAHPGRRPGDPRRQPPQLPRPVRDRHDGAAARSTTWPRRSCSQPAAQAGC